MNDALKDQQNPKSGVSERTKDWAKRIFFIGSLIMIAFAVKWEIGRRQASYRQSQIEMGLMPPESANWPLK